MNQLTQNSGNTKSRMLLALIISIIVISVCLLLVSKIKVTTSESQLTISGIYGISIDRTSIQSVELIDDFPIFGNKINGINMGFIDVGFFNYSRIGKIRLFELSKIKPYVLVITKNEKIVLALGKEKNSELYNKIKQLLIQNN